mgnify:CR=1 FL=1
MGIFNDTYDIDVSTQPMADKMREVSHHVNATTTAVGVMETAVIAQEKSSTDQICGKLDVGFFNVVMSQIAQRVANESAKTSALAMELMQQQKALQNLQSRMSGDYNMISARYAKLFGSLNQEMKNRIMELDKPVMQYCLQNVKQLQNRIYNLVSGVPVLQSESLTAIQAIAAARLKNNAQGLIENVAAYVKNDQQQQQTTEKLWNSSQEECVYYVPVVVDEEDTESRKGSVSQKENPLLRRNLDEVSYQRTVQALSNAMTSLSWHQSDETVANVANSYMDMVERSELPKRIKDLMTSMFNDQFKTL